MSEVERSNATITRDANKLLHRLVHDNAVAYPQDVETREWMGGYYVNNSKWRLREVCTILKRTKTFRRRVAIIKRSVDRVRVEKLSLKRSWDELDEAFGKLVNCLRTWPPNKRLQPAVWASKAVTRRG